MSLKSSRVAGFLSSLLFASVSVAASFAQPAWTFDRVVSCKDDADNNAILISTMKGEQISAPSIQYLPGPNGHAMMVADFAGLSYMMPPHIIHPVQPPGKWGIEEIRVGQFQVNPPICRVAAISRNPASLKGLSFTANSGSLIVKWTGPKGLVPDQIETAEVPARAPAKTDPVIKVAEKSDTPARVTQRNPASASDEPTVTKDSSVSVAKLPVKVATKTAVVDTKSQPVASVQGRSRPAHAPASDDEDIDRGIQQIQALLEAARRSKVGTAKTTDATTTKPTVAVTPIATTAAAAKPTISATPVATTAAAARPTISATPVTTIAAATKPIVSATPVATAAPTAKATVAAMPKATDAPILRSSQATPAQASPDSERNNKLLTTASQDQPDPTDRIKKPALDETTSAKNQPDTDTAEKTGSADLPSKEKSDGLRAEKKTEKPPGVPMARLSVVSDTDSSEPNAAIQLLSERNITYKSFRLHSPERYIIDLEKPPDLDEATVSIFQENSLCRSVRIGMTDKHTCRLVFDLTDDSVQVQEKTFEEDGKVLTLKIFSQPASMTTKSNRPLEGVSLVLDAGHGGSDPGAQRGDAREKEMTLGIINQLKKRLEANGAFITMTRSDDTFVSLEDRVKITNLVMPKAFVSVHINALESTNDIKGVETYFQTEQSKPLAEAVHNCLYTSLGVPNRGVRKARFYVINHTTVPAILAEVGYISNKDEREKLISSDYQGKIADALTQGVILYVNKNPETPVNAVKPAPVINPNQNEGKGTSAVPTKSVAASLSERADAVRAVR
ncbi:MAG: N-acetylmuramoyl-L-alanine amidase [Candidatus Obscuribacterales bacterium]